MASDLDRIARLARRASRPVVLIDGRSGSGKTELATELAPILGAQLVRLDDIYPGWDGLEAASELVLTEILRSNPWQRWDWRVNAPAEWNEIDPDLPLIVEGSGALSAANRMHATVGVWVELDAVTRRARALTRDGATYEPHWDDWAEQEQRFFDRERPDLLADVIVDRAES